MSGDMLNTGNTNTKEIKQPHLTMMEDLIFYQRNKYIYKHILNKCKINKYMVVREGRC